MNVVYNINSELCIPTFYLIHCTLYTNVPIKEGLGWPIASD